MSGVLHPTNTRLKLIKENVPYIPALALNANRCGISFFTYDLLEKEYWNVRSAFDWANRDIRLMFGAKDIPFHINTDGVLFVANDPHIFYEPHRPLPVGEYLFDNKDAEKLFCGKRTG